MDQGDRHVAEECLAGQPQEHGAVFPDRPQHSQVLKIRIRLAEYVNAPVFQLIQMIHSVPHQRWCSTRSSTFDTHCSTFSTLVSSVTSGCAGGSYGSST